MSSSPGKPPVLLAHTWEPKYDPKGWWMSEKLDGVRAYWDGTQFVSRGGIVYNAPKWFRDPLPSTKLDGELWIDRDSFQKCVGIVRRANGGDAWREVKYLVFDAPDHPGEFEERVDFIAQTVRACGVSHVVAVAQTRCRDAKHLNDEVDRIVEHLGGEGVMLRQPRSRYVAGRSRTLLKVKRFRDAEARVTGYVDGQGRHQGRVGALTVITPGGVTFNIGSGLSDAQRDDPPKVGDIVTYRYQELTKAGLPRFPTFMRIRNDFVWPGNTTADISRPAGTGASAPNASTAQAAPAATTAQAQPIARPDPTAALPKSTSATRHFTKAPGDFWEITTQGIAMAVRYGAIGTNGKTKIKTFATPEKAVKEAARLIARKVKKGFIEQPSG